MVLDPVAFSLFGLDVRWYGIAYAIGFLFAYFFIMKFYGSFGFKKSQEKTLEDVFFYTALATVVGGRVFHVIFYDFFRFIADPLSIFAVWNGGMSMHGGIFFGGLALWFFSRKHNLKLANLTDMFLVPAGLAFAFGRLANFVNQELVGTVTSSKIGIIFPNIDSQTRWPYQIFASFKNLAMFNILMYLHFFKKLKPGIITALFFILYNFGRFFIDFLRVPEVPIGIISMGQLMCLIFGTFGIYIYYRINMSKDS